MKKGYTKVLIIELILIAFLLLNSFVVNVLSNYMLVLFLFLSLCLYKIFFDFEKNKHRNTNDIIIYLIIYLLIVVVLYYAIGFFTGFVKIPNYYNLYGLFNIILPIVLTILISEFFRYQLLRKSEGNLKLIVLTTILFILVDVTNSIYFADFSSGYSIIVFVGITLLPSICKNIFCTYTSAKTWYKPAIILSLCVGLYKYLLPIIPDFNEYLLSMFSLLVLAVITLLLTRILKDESDVQPELDSRNQRKVFVAAYIFEILFAIILIYFVSGYFRYYAIAIASNSMYPTFERGSVAIIRKIDENYHELKVGDIIAYHYENRIIAHRIAKMIEVDETKYYYTKGDANEGIDNYVVRQDMIMGTINTYIPFIGYPTVWLNELLTD